MTFSWCWGELQSSTPEPRRPPAEHGSMRASLGCWFHWTAGWRCGLVLRGEGGRLRWCLAAQRTITDWRLHAWLPSTLRCCFGQIDPTISCHNLSTGALSVWISVYCVCVCLSLFLALYHRGFWDKRGILSRLAHSYVWIQSLLAD